MFERTFKVKYITLKNCFCYLSDKYYKSVQQENVVKLNYGNNKLVYFSVGAHLSTLKENEIGINSIYAQTLQLEEGDCVLFILCNNVPGIKKINVTPGSNDDYEILELMAENVQLTLLDQIRVVDNNQNLIIWISNSLHIIVRVDGTEPLAPGRLDYLTEVVVKPPVTHKKVIKSNPWNINDLFKYFNSYSNSKNNLFKKYDCIKTTLVFRLHPIKDISNIIEQFNNKAYFNVFFQRNILPEQFLTNNLCTLREIEPPSVNVDFGTSERKTLVVRLCSFDVEDVQAQETCFYPLFINHSIFEHYNLKIGSKVTLDHFDGTVDADKIEICTNKTMNETLQRFKLYVADCCKDEKVLLNSNFPIDIGGFEVVLKFTPSDRKACLIDGNFIRNCQISVSEGEFSKFTKDVKKSELDVCMDCGNFKEIVDGCCKYLYFGLSSNHMENILITGKPGSGKTTIAKSFIEKVSRYQFYFHVETINCKNIKGKSIDSLHKLFTNTLLKLIYYQPSVLILDDLHIICEKVVDGDAPTQESIHTNKVSELLAELFDHYLKNNFICLLATTESSMKLNEHVFTSRGRHLFKNVFSIAELNKIDRKSFLSYKFSKQADLDDIDLEKLSAQTEGFVVQDLVDFVDKCFFESYKEDASSVSHRHCEIALKNTTSLSLKNVQLHSPGDRDFSDIGGLEDIKNVLVESMLWPAQFANIFGKAPLRLQSGLLLYGAPGTGKTILAGAAAKQCGLRLISVKGPELLSKYIGASEQAVRDVFQKAQSAKPCILFFDEFDSLAPRRGHDNTGVTDRVVNQFLTQLDGIEALTGVCVLAATSRPDLLDPALLRPGRLDRQILCPLPNKAARLEILKVLSKKLTFASDVDLDKISDETEGFSGADLQGVLYTAQLTSVEHLLNENVDSSFENLINQNHLEEAVKSTRPSLTREEKLKFERIYARFQGKGDVMDVRSGKQRATLA